MFSFLQTDKINSNWWNINHFWTIPQHCLFSCVYVKNTWQVTGCWLVPDCCAVSFWSGLVQTRSLSLHTVVPEGHHEGNRDVQQQGGAQEPLGAEAWVQTLPAPWGRGGADHLVPATGFLKVSSSRSHDHAGFSPAPTLLDLLPEGERRAESLLCFWFEFVYLVYFLVPHQGSSWTLVFLLGRNGTHNKTTETLFSLCWQ